MRISNPRGGYDFLRGISPYSAGAVAQKGFVVEHARFSRPLPLKAGFDAIDAHLRKLNRPKQSLCGMELRSPKPFTFTGFSDFNKGYVAVLKSWDVLMPDGLNPVARTNVAPEIEPPAEPSIHGFSYTMPANTDRRTFIIAGAGELPEGSLDPHDVVRRGETSPAAIAEKARYVMGLMEGRLQGLGLSWADATVTGIYTAHDIHPFLRNDVLKRMGKASGQGVTWHYSRPPIETIEYEMDIRGTIRDLVL
ncbi:MAG: hypothetical protein JNL98_08705 [Bryobacterales bacterium]|nr:hypothetical protein [Bryobacterales bacterium]